MGITNPWLNSYQRSYQQIKAKLIDDLKNIKDSNGNTLITDYSEGNIFILLISMFSAIAEVLHYYIDNMSRETFFSTARRYDSLVKHGELVDYHARGAIAPTVDVQLSRPLTSNYISSEVVISKGTTFGDNAGNTWTVVRDTKWYANTTLVNVPLIQHTSYVDSRMVGIVIPNIRPNKVIRIPVPSLGNGYFYENNSMTLSIGGESWVLVDTFAFSGKYDKHFRTEIDANQNLNIVFGDGVHGAIPDPGYQITSCSYNITKGLGANVKEGSINLVPNAIKNVIADAVCSNIHPASGGSNYEDFDMLRNHIPLYVRTLGVAITKQDFVDLAMQVDGVNKCVADYECGRKLNLYITPDNGTVASSTLCNNVYNFLKAHAPLTTWLRVRSAGITEIFLDIEVTGKKSFSSDEISAQVTNALLDKYSVTHSEIGGQVRISDIYALIDNLSMVDYLHINKFYIKPWPTTIYGNIQLNISQFVLNSIVGTVTYFITFTSNLYFEIRASKGGYVLQGVSMGSPVTVNDQANKANFSISIANNGYSMGYKYSITISEPNRDYIEPGFNLPVFDDPDNLSINIHEVL